MKYTILLLTMFGYVFSSCDATEFGSDAKRRWWTKDGCKRELTPEQRQRWRDCAAKCREKCGLPPRQEPHPESEGGPRKDCRDTWTEGQKTCFQTCMEDCKKTCGCC